MDGWPKPSTEGKISDKAAVLAEIKSPCTLAAEPDADNLARNNLTQKKAEKDLKALLEDSESCSKTSSDTPGKSELLKNNFTQQESVSDLSESGLKALLEEAVSYKTPSDVHGKSELFKVLLQSIETDNDYASRGERQEKTSRKLRRRLRKDADPKCGSHGSLQDLADVGRSGDVKAKDGPSSSSSIVSKHGPYENDDDNRLNPDHNSFLHNGNLESVQDFQHFFCGENKPAELIDSTITIPLTYIRGSLNQNGLEDPDVERSCINEALKAVRCLEQTALDNKDDNLASKESIYPAEKKVDENGNALNTSSAERKGKCRRLKAKNDKNTIMSHHIEGHRSDIAQDIDALMQYIESPTKNDGDIKSSSNRQQRNHTQRMTGSSGGGCKLRPHRDKSSDTVRKGQRKNKDNNKFKKSTSLEELSISKFEDLTSSEGNDNKSETSAETYRRDDEVRMTESSGSVVEKSHAALSMAREEAHEVLSTSSKRPPVSLQGTSPQRKETIETTENVDSMEFHTVTKKQRKKKDKMLSGQNKLRNKVHNFQVNSGKQDRNFYPYESKQRNLFKRNHLWQRRKSTSSVPSSDKSGESCDDLDSVHSLPISTSSARAMCNDINKAPNTTVSYAAIARSVPAPIKPGNCESQISEAVDKTSSWSSPEDTAPLPDLIPSVMLPLPSKKEKPKIAPVVNNPDDYPPLSSDSRDDSSRDMFVEYTVIVPKKEKCTYSSSNNNINNHQESASVEKTVVVKMPPTKNPSPVSHVEQNVQHTVKRPAVILMSENKEPSVVQDLEFGFEINQQLLSSTSMDNGMEEDPPQDDVEGDEDEDEEEDWASVSENAVTETQTDAASVASSSSGPTKNEAAESLKEINPLVAFINSEWELVMKELALDRESKTGKVVYYSSETH